MSSLLSRREFLRQSGIALAGLAIPIDPGRGWDLPFPLEDRVSRAGHALGRVASDRLKVRAEPNREAKTIGHRVYDQIISLYGEAEGPGELAHNPIWFKTKGGYVHSSFVQPVKRYLNRPLLPSQVSEERPVLVEVTMPYTDIFRQPTSVNPRSYRLYYATTHWAVAVERDEAKNSWYKLRNDRGQGHYYARAEHMRPISADELAPISPGTPDKWIEVNLTKQRLTAYEGDKVVVTALVATGTIFDSDDGIERDYRTPIGTFPVLRKRASRHMQGGTEGIDYYDLPGVPWVTYFTWSGVALHGTYWHNDYGRQRSHGCVNLTPQQARWLYRWTEPEVPAEEEVLEAKGTLIRVVQ
jgi:lipoprotein-anchoring transpeptidase ErfK/SrfK